MAKAAINLQKESGGIIKISPIDGIGVTEVTVPESGNLVSVDTVVIDNAIARYDGTTGKLQNSGVVVDDIGNIGVGVTPSSSLSFYKMLEVNGAVLAGHNNKTNAELYSNTYLDSSGVSRYLANSNATYLSMYQGRYTFNAASAGINGNPITWTQQMTLDAFGNLLLTSGTGALGYGAGAGGTVTQLTSKTASVTLNKPSGKIIMSNSSLAAGATAGFAFNNSLIGADDKIEVEAVFSAVYYHAYVYFSTTGVACIAVENKGFTERTDTFAIKFVIIKGATA